MEPLSFRKRISFLIVLIVLFAIILPITFLYATGYRFNGLSLFETGGVFISVPVPGVSVSINGTPTGTSGLLTRSAYVDGLKPGVYVVEVTREGYYPWHKTLVVDPWIVIDASAFLVPEDISILPVRITTAQTSSTTYSVSVSDYQQILADFASSTPLRSGTTTLQDLRGGQSLRISDGALVIEWEKNQLSLPSAFCATPTTCSKDLVVRKAKKDAIHSARFFAGGVVYRTDSGIFLAEADARPTQVIVPLYQKPKADFRIIQGTLFVKDGEHIYALLGL